MNTRQKKAHHRRLHALVTGAAGGASAAAATPDAQPSTLMSVQFDPLMKILLPTIQSLHADGTFGRMLPADSLANIQQMKNINKTLYRNIRTYMHENTVYCDAVRKLSLFVPGTRIPCGIENATPLVRLRTRGECVELFEATNKLMPNKVRVGGMYLPALYLENWNEYGTWDGPDDVDGAVTHRTFYMTISLHFLARPFFQVLPPRIGNSVDVSGIPDTLRKVLGLQEPICDFEILREQRDRVGVYFRLLHIRSDHTTQDIFDSISLAEGWNPVKDYRLRKVGMGAPYSFLPLTYSVFRVTKIAIGAGVACRPSITWQHFAVPLHTAYQDTSEDDSDGSGEADSQAASEENSEEDSEEGNGESVVEQIAGQRGELRGKQRARK